MKLSAEHKFYGVEPEILSKDFIAGLIVGEGTFYWTKNDSYKIPVFALRMHIRDFDLILNFKYSLGVKEKVYEYNHNKRHYAFLILRSFESLKKLIEDIYPRLAGYKKHQFQECFMGFKDTSLAPRYTAIYNIFKNKFPELYT